MKQIRIKISPEGHIEAETIGVKGKACLKYIEEIEKMTDAVCEDSKFSNEYYESENWLVTEAETEVRF